ncbi:MAG: hypothetical protein ABIJ45_08490, partial [Candidatus Zixiibacteriota bacterium]
IKEYIEDLFDYLNKYENSYDNFKTEAFFQTYHGISAMFQALRQQRDKAIEVDQYFLSKIKQGPLTSSDLRQLTIQVIITFFESEADTDGQSNKTYLYCRDLRTAKRDVTFFEESLVPMLFRTGSLNNNFELNSFLLGEIGRYISKFASGVHTDMSPEAFLSKSDPMKILELSRRRTDLGSELAKDRNSLEFHLQGVGEFNKLSEKNKIFEQYLRAWGYLVENSFWSIVKAKASDIWSRILNLFSSFRYFRLSLTERNSAYFYYSILILIFVLLAIYVPIKWNNTTKDKLNELEQRATSTYESANK